MFLNLLWLAILLIGLALGVACSDTPPTPPQPQPMPTAIVGAYQEWGQTLYAERSPDAKWKDGSNWTDGVSQSPPVLPIGRNEYIGPNLTCAQAEVLQMAVFPEGEGYDVYHLELSLRRRRHWSTMERGFCDSGMGRPFLGRRRSMRG